MNDLIEIKAQLNYVKDTKKLKFTYDKNTREITNWIEFYCNQRMLDAEGLYDKEVVLLCALKKRINTKGKEITTYSPKKIIVGNKTFERKRSNSNALRVIEETFPYNFISLREDLKEINEGYSNHSIFKEDLLSGFIEFEIELLSALMIRGEKENFFSVNNFPTIPGSSIRGLISNIANILSQGSFTQFDNKRIFQRKMFSDGSSSHQYYKNNKSTPKVGFLKFCHTTKKYQLNIDPENKYDPVVNSLKLQDNEIKFEKGNFFTNSGEFHGKKKIWLITPNSKWRLTDKKYLKEIDQEDIKNYNQDINRNIPKSVNPIELCRNFREILGTQPDLVNSIVDYGVPVFYSVYKDLANKERIAFGHTKNFRIPYHKNISDHVPPNLLKDDSKDYCSTIFGNTTTASKIYFEDITCKSNGLEIFEPQNACKVLGNPNPSYYPAYLKQPNGVRTKKNKINHWGSDKSTIRGYKFYHHINNDKHWINKEISIKKDIFEDYISERNITSNIAEGILSEFKFSDGNMVSLEPYDELSIQTKKVIYDFCFDEKFKTKTQFTILKPVKKATEFKKGRIRFNNFSKQELGCILLSLILTKKSAHKLGYAKPYGLGSIKFKNISTNLTERKKRYTKVFEEQGSTFNSATTVVESEEFIKAFIISMGFQNKEDFWNDKVNKELKDIQEWNSHKKSQSTWIENVSYMEPFDGFTAKKILPEIQEFLELTNYHK